MNERDFIVSILSGLDDALQEVAIPATLVVGDRTLSTGEVLFSKSDPLSAEFVPTPGNEPVTFPMSGGILILKGRAERLRALDLQRGGGVFHNRLRFRYEVLHA